MGENSEAMRPERKCIKKGEKMDVTHKQVLRKGCCAQKIDLQRKKGAEGTQQICVNRFREDRKMCKGHVLCKSLLETKQEASGKKKNEKLLLCFLSLPSLTGRIGNVKTWGALKLELKAGFAF